MSGAFLPGQPLLLHIVLRTGVIYLLVLVGRRILSQGFDRLHPVPKRLFSSRIFCRDCPIRQATSDTIDATSGERPQLRLPPRPRRGFLIDSLLKRKIEKRPNKVRLQGRILSHRRSGTYQAAARGRGSALGHEKSGE